MLNPHDRDDLPEIRPMSKQSSRMLVVALMLLATVVAVGAAVIFINMARKVEQRAQQEQVDADTTHAEPGSR